MTALNIALVFFGSVLYGVVEDWRALFSLTLKSLSFAIQYSLCVLCVASHKRCSSFCLIRNLQQRAFVIYNIINDLISHVITGDGGQQQ